jgi:hypothetical protein
MEPPQEEAKGIKLISPIRYMILIFAFFFAEIPYQKALGTFLVIAHIVLQTASNYGVMVRTYIQFTADTSHKCHLTSQL